MAYETLIVETPAEGVQLIRLNRPQALNALNSQLLGELSQALDAAETETLAPRLKDVVVPTSIVWGAEDPFLPASLGARLREAIPGATLDVVPDVRHFTPEEAPQRVAEALEKLLVR